MTLRWPADEALLPDLRARDVPRLLLVAPDAPPPNIEGVLEDWVRLPAKSADVAARRETLRERSRTSPGSASSDPTPPGPAPTLDQDGVLRFEGRWVAIPPVEGRLLGLFLEKYGAVVSRRALSKAGWPDRDADRNVLDVHILRLRRRLDEVGLAIRTVRSRGYLLEPARRAALSVRRHDTEAQA